MNTITKTTSDFELIKHIAEIIDKDLKLYASLKGVKIDELYAEHLATVIVSELPEIKI
jgi:hypothetical protein